MSSPNLLPRQGDVGGQKAFPLCFGYIQALLQQMPPGGIKRGLFATRPNTPSSNFPTP